MENKPEITKIAPVSFSIISSSNGGKKRVCAYARVSTEKDSQRNSLEAQKNYYTKLIKSKPEWEYAGLYADEGISGTAYHNRDAFNKMIESALEGNIDIILTKSFSRFARNTVDTLTIIRELKAMGVVVFFEKEDINTLDSKGEFLITLLSSLAEEESQSISENCTCGQIKRFADGKATVPFSRFLGYDRGKNGEFVINEKEAVIVRSIYLMFIINMPVSAIIKKLDSLGVLTAAKKPKWHNSVVYSILKLDLESDINADLKTLIDLKREVVTIIKCVERPELQTILEMRYLCFETWEEIAVSLHYDLRHIHRLHGRALEEVDFIRRRQ